MTDPEVSELSERELEILRLVATGASNKEIAQRLFISTNTVKVHLRNIFAKISVASRTEAALYALKHGLVDRPVVVPGSEVGSGSSEQQDGTAEANGGQFSDLSVEAAPALAGRPPLRFGLFAGLFILFAALLVWVFTVNRTGGVASTQVPVPTPTPQPRWLVLPNMPAARRGLGVAAYESQVFAIAGETSAGVSGLVERFDPATGLWERRAEKPTPVTDISAAVVRGLIYLPGGRTASGQLTDVLEIYDPLDDHWTTGAALPQPISAYALAAFEGRLYLFGGWDGQGEVSTVYEYDPSLDEWVERTPMPTARSLSAAAVSGSRIFVLGGTAEGKALAANEAYLPNLEGSDTSPWETAASLPEARSGLGAASVADLIYVIGGEGGENPQPLSLEFAPQVNEWRQFPAPPIQISWAQFGTAAIATTIFSVGGAVEGELIAQNLAYQAVFTIAIPLLR